MAVIRLGLIGDNIARSQSPRLHVAAGALCGLDVTYDRLIPRDLGLDFDAVFERCTREGYRGINITYPYKETVVSRVTVADATTARIKACNTVIFEPAGPRGHNTDWSGFAAAFRASFGDAQPGKVAMAGAGGVGKAIAFALCELGASEMRLFDADADRTAGLAAALAKADFSTEVIAASSMAAAAAGADGIVNATPLGMAGHPGSPFDRAHLAGAIWAFDAVYTPVETEFLRLAETEGLALMSGWELFFHQGVQAFRHFTGHEVDADALRRAILEPDLRTLDA